jgi:hypothetical protein
MTNRSAVQYLLLALAFNVIALLLPLAGVASASHSHWILTFVLFVAAAFNALAVRQFWIKRQR